MIKKDLFEVLRDKIHCVYVSDLKFMKFDRIRDQLERLDYDDFELKEILDAINWFGMTRMGRPIKDDAKRASVTIRMSDETNKKLKEYAAKHNLSMTEVALRSLEEYLSKEK